MNNCLEKLKLDYKIKPVLILGEIHGADVNVDIIKFFIEELKPQVIFFEWLKFWDGKLIRYTENTVVLENILKKVPSGAITIKHFDLLKYLSKKSIKVVVIDEGGDSWNERDKKMSKNILEEITKNKIKKAIVVVGNLHARKKSFMLNDKYLVPVATYFSSQAVSVNIRYGKGKISNFGEKEVNDIYVLKHLPKNTSQSLLIAESKNFDYDFLIRETKPAELI